MGFNLPPNLSAADLDHILGDPPDTFECCVCLARCRIEKATDLEAELLACPDHAQYAALREILYLRRRLEDA